MAEQFIRIELRGGVGERFAAIRARLDDFSPVGPQVLDAMRHGEGSVEAQSLQQTTLGMAGATPWKATQPFGNRPAPVRTLYRTGRYIGAWLGGSGGLSEVGPKSFAVGVSGATFPQAHVFQASGPTVIRAKTRNRRGRLSMQVYLGMEFGAWISAARLLSGLVVEPRRFAINPVMLGRVRKILVGYALRGEAQAVAA